MFKLIEKAIGIIQEYSEIDISQIFFASDNQDYYRCRSRYLADKILNSLAGFARVHLAHVLNAFIERVPSYKICMYDKFKRNAFDSLLISSAFPNCSNGENFYEKVIVRDNSEYSYQQAALYFAKLGEYKKAFEWINKAQSLSNHNRFSINSTYAQIYFDVNVENDTENAEKALNILVECCTHDKRKSIHFALFAKKVITFYEYHSYSKASSFINVAYKILNTALEKTASVKLSENNKKELNYLKNKLAEIMTQHE